jgi:hypothetical protein
MMIAITITMMIIGGERAERKKVPPPSPEIAFHLSGAREQSYRAQPRLLIGSIRILINYSVFSGAV